MEVTSAGKKFTQNSATGSRIGIIGVCQTGRQPLLLAATLAQVTHWTANTALRQD
jgi:hypothetical protein